MKFRHITINVKDLEASIAFYEEVADLKVARRLESGPAKLAFLHHEEGDTEVELLQFPDREFSGKGMFLCFECDTLDSMHALVTAKKLNPSPIQEPDDGSRYFYVYDPDGVSVQLREWPV